MAHFAEIDENNIVLRVIVADQSFIDSGRVGNPSNWIQTSYHTRRGKHRLGGMPVRGNYAGVGYTYDRSKDAFLPPKPYTSWIYDDENIDWKAPKEEPQDGKFYTWNETILDWEEIKAL